MGLESDGREKHTSKALIKSFTYAGEGILTVLRIGRNIKIHCLVGWVVILAGRYFEISKIEFMILLLVIMQVICLEMVNTSIERTIDLLTEKHHIYAKIAKDVAAGAVLVSVVTAVVIGIMIFFPYLQTLI